MQLKYFFTVVFLAVILVVFAQLITADSGPHSTSPTTIPGSYTPNAQAANVGVTDEASAPILATADAAESQVTLAQDGATLLQDHCTQCHDVQLLEQSKKSRTDWEKTLSRMEKMGVRLSVAERSALLDYLADTDES